MQGLVQGSYFLCEATGSVRTT